MPPVEKSCHKEFLSIPSFPPPRHTVSTPCSSARSLVSLSEFRRIHRPRSVCAAMARIPAPVSDSLRTRLNEMIPAYIQYGNSMRMPTPHICIRCLCEVIRAHGTVTTSRTAGCPPFTASSACCSASGSASGSVTVFPHAPMARAMDAKSGEGERSLPLNPDLPA